MKWHGHCVSIWMIGYFSSTWELKQNYHHSPVNEMQWNESTQNLRRQVLNAVCKSPRNAGVRKWHWFISDSSQLMGTPLETMTFQELERFSWPGQAKGLKKKKKMNKRLLEIKGDKGLGEVTKKGTSLWQWTLKNNFIMQWKSKDRILKCCSIQFSLWIPESQ